MNNLKKIMNLIYELGYYDSIGDGDKIYNSVEDAYKGIDFTGLNEIAPVWVMRKVKGVNVRKQACPAGYRLKDGTCEQIPPEELRQKMMQKK